MRITVGAPPLGSDFYPGRQIIVNELKRKLERNDVIVVGPRRTGKTCTIQEYLRQEQEANSKYKGIYVDLQTAQSLYEFYLRIIKKVFNTSSKWSSFKFDAQEKLKEISNSLRHILNIEADMSSYIGTDADISLNFKLPEFKPETVNSLADKLKEILENLDENVTLVLDEFPELIWKFGKEKELGEQIEVRKMMTEHLLGGFRSLRQEGGEARKYRIVIAGSVNLHSTLEHLDLSNLVNDVEHLKIPLLQTAQTVDLFTQLSEGEEFKFSSTEVINTFLENQFGNCSPYYIQLFADLLRQEMISHMGKITFSTGILKKNYKDLLTDTRGPRTLKVRIEKYYDTEAKNAKDILRCAAIYQFHNDASLDENAIYQQLKDQFSNNREQFNEDIAKLKCDGLIYSLGENELGFSSQLICNLWNYILGEDGAYLK